MFFMQNISHGSSVSTFSKKLLLPVCQQNWSIPNDSISKELDFKPSIVFNVRPVYHLPLDYPNDNCPVHFKALCGRL